MYKRFRSEKSALTQVQSFMDQNPGPLAQVNASDARKALDQSVDGLTAGEADQGLHRGTSKQARVEHEQARKTLVNQMRAVAAAARLKTAEEPTLVSIVMPSADVSTPRLLVAARDMMTLGLPFIDLLAPVVGRGYFDKVVTSIVAVEQAQAVVKESRARLSAATKDVKRWMDVGRLGLRALKPLVIEALASEPKLLDEWNERRKKIGVSRKAPNAAVQDLGLSTAAT